MSAHVLKKKYTFYTQILAIDKIESRLNGSGMMESDH